MIDDLTPLKHARISDWLGRRGAWLIMSPNEDCFLAMRETQREAKKTMREWAKLDGQEGYYDLFDIGTPAKSIMLKEDSG